MSQVLGEQCLRKRSHLLIPEAEAVWRRVPSIVFVVKVIEVKHTVLSVREPGHSQMLRVLDELIECNRVVDLSAWWKPLLVGRVTLRVQGNHI